MAAVHFARLGAVQTAALVLAGTRQALAVWPHGAKEWQPTLSGKRIGLTSDVLKGCDSPGTLYEGEPAMEFAIAQSG